MTLNRIVYVQGSPSNGFVSGTVEWWEFVDAWWEYDKKYRTHQSPNEIEERGGFSYGELVDFLHHPPTTWVPNEKR